MPSPDSPEASPQKPVPEPVFRSFWSAVALAWELGYLIAIPAFVLGGGGALLDKRLSTSPWLVLLGFILALTISAITVIRRVRAIIK